MSDQVKKLMEFTHINIADSILQDLSQGNLSYLDYDLQENAYVILSFMSTNNGRTKSYNTSLAFKCLDAYLSALDINERLRKDIRKLLSENKRLESENERLRLIESDYLKSR